MPKNHNGGIYIPSGRSPWPHELRVAKILALAGHRVEFLSENGLRSPDIRLDGIKYEIKSPETDKTSSLEQSIRTALLSTSVAKSLTFSTLFDIIKTTKPSQGAVCT